MLRKKDGNSVVGFVSESVDVPESDFFIPMLGVILLVSVFFPWLQESSVHGFDLNSVMASVGVLGGLLVLIISWSREPRIRGGVCLAVGGLSLLLLLAVCLTTSDVSSGGVSGGMRSFFAVVDNTLGWGAFLYGFTALGLITWGLGEIQRKK